MDSILHSKTGSDRPKLLKTSVIEDVPLGLWETV